MEHEVSLSSAQDTAIGPYPEPVECSLLDHIMVILRFKSHGFFNTQTCICGHKVCFWIFQDSQNERRLFLTVIKWLIFNAEAPCLMWAELLYVKYVWISGRKVVYFQIFFFVFDSA
jgi:hypothetical protein